MHTSLHPSGYLLQDLTAPCLRGTSSAFPPHYDGIFGYHDDPFGGKRADRDRACRELSHRMTFRSVGDDRCLWELTPLLTEEVLIRDCLEAAFAMDIPTRWLFLCTDAPNLRYDGLLPPMTLLGYEIFPTNGGDGTIMEDLWWTVDSPLDPIGKILAHHRAHTNENGLFATESDCRDYFRTYTDLSLSGRIGDMEPGEEEDFCIAAVYETTVPTL